jgi:hypothetical protein
MLDFYKNKKMTNLLPIITQYKADTQSVYNTWFIDNDQRLKAFRTIRRGVLQVVEDIKNKALIGFRGDTQILLNP